MSKDPKIPCQLIHLEEHFRWIDWALRRPLFRFFPELTMWVSCKLKADRTLEDIAKEYRNTDIGVLLKHPKNKIAAKSCKAKQPVPKGSVVWLLDPKAKCYPVKTPKGIEIYNEKEWKACQQQNAKSMDKTFRRVKMAHDNIAYRHDLQLEVNAEFPFVAFFSSNWVGSEGNEPTSERKASANAVAKLEKVVRARNMAVFEGAYADAKRKIEIYQRALQGWIKQLTGSAENWETGLTVVKETSFWIFGASAMTVAAPATGLAAVGYGALVGGGTKFMASTANEVGRALSGSEVNMSHSSKKVLLDVVNGAAFGGFTAGLGRLVSRSLLDKFAAKLIDKRLVVKLGNQFLKRCSWWSKLTDRVYFVAMNSAKKQVAKEFTGRAAKEVPIMLKGVPTRIFDHMAADVLVKFVTRLGLGGIRKAIDLAFLNDLIAKKAKDWAREEGLKMKGKATEEQIAKKMAEDLADGPMLDSIFEHIVRNNQAAIAKEIEQAYADEMVCRVREIQKKQK
ncbi:hypothetical protein AB2B41_21000 [Marimonas sp. MJW-29]|uniref:LysM domain-containing protein n=1 Tax=Sulfitobacter sediminis TaxID=3234186 RepID=A0ABV3RSX2_9RHOB